MCGIAGVFNLNKKEVFYEDYIKSFKSLSHRGPEGNNFKKIKKNLIFSHNKLAIIGDNLKNYQPFVDITNQFAITFNGAIYNYLELKDELEGLNVNFFTDTDTEVILNSYKIWGEECVKKFEGMWAFAIWDNKNNKVFLSRDRFGEKPLYYSLKENIFYFASEIKTFALFNENYGFNFELIASFKDDVYGEETFLKNVRSLAPGHNLTINENKTLNINKWYNFFQIITILIMLI